MDKITGRTDDMMIIRGVNVFPSQIEEILLQQEAMAPHYQIVMSRDNNMVGITVNAEARPGTGDADREKLADHVSESIKEFIGISANVNILPEGEVPRSAGKAQRVVDNR
ncbi:MAG: phenylacetate--CoA ligase [Proteobacteria bacterium]|nr:phenylacetate--CoA ligase [Pseudomonadota bacterium]